MSSLSGPIEGDPKLISTFFDLGALGYVAEEYFLSGDARSYETAGETGDDGRWQARESGRAPFTTRMVVYRPADPAAFNGSVVLEWLNVTAGADAPAGWLTTHRHLLRAGFAWIGVSVQRVSVEGGGILTTGSARDDAHPPIVLPALKQSDAGRYAALAHPGDAFALDIFTQAGAAARRPGGSGVLGPLTASRVLAMGQSQSAAYLVTYVNAIAPIADGFDGYLIHGRPGRPAHLAGWRHEALAGGVRVRTDGAAPILVLQSETDVFGVLASLGSRQPDDDRLRLWEVAGAAHADTYTMAGAFSDSGGLSAGELATLLAPKTAPLGVAYEAPINSGPQQHYVAQAALAALDRWAREGAPPPVADRLFRDPDDPSAPRLDRHGIATGGVRTPWVDVPVAVLSGLGQERSPRPAMLFGSTHPFDAATLAALYPSGPADYCAAFQASAERTVAAGFLLAEDLEEIVALAAASFPG
ncbi:alpha/beta hydrolase domain-containing protein [Actinomadura sp. DC4]|uniref:alpha/beta hydrolase domain-containing protein n=1 Tax=Actinomadura sp. DC4 TaxID=3055069 RepID=UPI0025AED0E0|nr:alpha/beta hydrolase domain-containing protein [Actinomadura sp. DC4]MDN3357557.1 alpha/beta hydrolase domain-containing protein [Actinomadura sp. DC4]